jgi:hypothetical protein
MTASVDTGMSVVEDDRRVEQVFDNGGTVGQVKRS